jgi:hypothetical protein
VKSTQRNRNHALGRGQLNVRRANGKSASIDFPAAKRFDAGMADAQLAGDDR